jgi:threonyl-tRNA synthetase
VADFGRLHRYERGGVVHGLTRVRSFSQDDAHIFCMPEQLESEALAFNRLVFDVYGTFGFTDLAVKLALRPTPRMGSDETWDMSEGALRRVLRESKIDFEELPGEGAFYGPKVEYHVKDAIGRSWQLGTIQLDYSMPERFGLEFIGTDGKAQRPVMLHRAIFGSLERFFGVYIEHVAGKFPVWIAPEQATLVTVSEKQAEYARRVRAELRARGLRIGLDDGADKLGAKIRNARLTRVPYVAVIGEKEAQASAVAPKTGDGKDLGAMPISEFAERLVRESKPPRPSKN